MINPKHCLSVLCIGSSLASFSQDKGQSVIASAGDVSKGKTIILEWTVGEPAIETLSTSAAVYTQGFHQPLLEVIKISGRRELALIKNSVRVYPNPVTAIINVQLDKPTEEPLMVSLLDASGKMLLNKAFPVNTTQLRINVVGLSQGTYILRVINGAGMLQGEYKIVKAQ